MSDQQEAFYERAAIIQFCSGLPTMTCEQAEEARLLALEGGE